VTQVEDMIEEHTYGFMNKYNKALNAFELTDYDFLGPEQFENVCSQFHHNLKNNAAWPSLPAYNKDVVLSFYYVFNCISYDFGGVTPNKIKKVIEIYMDKRKD